LHTRQSLYLIPGTMCDHRLWDSFISALELVRPNYFDFHFVTIAQKNTIDDIVDDIRQQLPRQKIHLLGFSLGGYLASAFALKFPELIDSLYVVSNMPCALPDKEIKERSRAVAWIKRNGYSGISQKRILALLDKSAHQRKEVVSLIKEMDESLGQDVLVHQLLTTTKREDIFIELEKLTLNKYFCVGRNDHLVSVEALTKLQLLDKHMKLSIIENAGHMLPLEKTDALAQWLNSMIATECKTMR
jgi:2-succinyl-6-hydroxy-2,4-cyclohexadiene-1-carboxylate synthase